MSREEILKSCHIQCLHNNAIESQSGSTIEDANISEALLFLWRILIRFLKELLKNSHLDKNDVMATPYMYMYSNKKV